MTKYQTYELMLAANVAHMAISAGLLRFDAHRDYLICRDYVEARHKRAFCGERASEEGITPTRVRAILSEWGVVTQTYAPACVSIE